MTTAADISALIPELVLTYVSEQRLADFQALQYWRVTAEEEDFGNDGEPVRTHVWEAEIMVGDLTAPDLSILLDADTVDTARFITLLDPDTDTGLATDLSETIRGFGTTLVMLNSATLRPDLRGHGLGTYLAGRALERFTPDAALLATYPGALGGFLHGRTREGAAARLATSWARLGFGPRPDGLAILDPHQVTFDERLAALAEHLGHPA